MRDINQLSSSEAVNCKTYEEDIEFRQLLHEAGKRWNSGDSYPSLSYWGEHGSQICYRVDANKKSSVANCIRQGYTIVDASEFIDPQKIARRITNQILI